MFSFGHLTRMPKYPRHLLCSLKHGFNRAFREDCQCFLIKSISETIFLYTVIFLGILHHRLVFLSRMNNWVLINRHLFISWKKIANKISNQTLLIFKLTLNKHNLKFSLIIFMWQMLGFRYYFTSYLMISKWEKQ